MTVAQHHFNSLTDHDNSNDTEMNDEHNPYYVESEENKSDDENQQDEE